MPRKENKTNGKKRLNIETKRTIINPVRFKVKHKQTPAKTRVDNPTNLQVKQPTKPPGKQPAKPVKSPGGRGLGKAGARRLGQLLKRAIQEKKNVKGNEKLPLPMTPVRLFKYQALVEAETEHKSRVTKTGPGLPRVSQLILRVVSQCKHRGGISMVELKHALAAGGYDVNKNNTRVNLAVKGLVRKETLFQTTGRGASGSFKLNRKKLTNEKNVRTRAMRLHEAALKAKQKKTAAKPAREKGTLKPNGKAVKQGANTGKPLLMSPKPAGKSPKSAVKSPKPAGKSTKPAGKSPKPAGKSPKPTKKATTPKESYKKVRDGPKRVGKGGKSARPRPKSPKKAKKPGNKSLKTAGKRNQQKRR